MPRPPAGFSARFAQAWLYAHALHADQVRKGTAIPYITHLMSVAGIVADYGGDEEQVIAALLHDAVEDQGGPPRLVEIHSQFGPRVAAIVQACTDADVTPKPPWASRKRAYIAHLDAAPADALLVSAADKLHNARTLLADVRREGLATFARFNGQLGGTLWYYHALVAAFQRRAVHPLFDELERTVRALCEAAESSYPPPDLPGEP